MRILGIDPGVAIVGFGLIETERSAVRMLSSSLRYSTS